MIIKNILDEDFVNYKKPSMYIAFPYCSFKCERECGIKCCQNSKLALSPNINISAEEIVKRYLNNFITKAMLCCGMEPFDSFDDVLELLNLLRDSGCNDDFVIYTGYNKNEITDKINILKNYSNVIIKFGRFIPNSISKYDDVLEVTLASDNQYAEKIS